MSSTRSSPSSARSHRASRPALRSLGDTSLTGRRAVDESANEIRELRRVAAGAGGVGEPLRQFLQSLDDRERAIETDLRALTDPPAFARVAVEPAQPRAPCARLHRHGGDPQLPLLADAHHQRLRRRQPLPPGRPDRRREPRGELQPDQPGAGPGHDRAVQLLRRPEPAGRRRGRRRRRNNRNLGSADPDPTERGANSASVSAQQQEEEKSTAGSDEERGRLAEGAAAKGDTAVDPESLPRSASPRRSSSGSGRT